MSNLMYPVWVPVLCNESVKADVLCLNPNRTENGLLPITTVNIHIQCDEEYILFDENCYYVAGILKENTKSIEHISKTNQNFLDVVLKYVSNVAFVNIMFCFKVKCYQFDSLTKTFLPQHIKLTDQAKAPLYVSEGKLKNHLFEASNKELQIHKCNSGEYLSKKLYHDGYSNCASKDVESGITCFIYNQQIKNHSFCKTLCLRPKCTCTEMYYQSLYGGCFPYKDKCNDKPSVACLLNFHDNITKYTDTEVDYVFDTKITFLSGSISYNEKVAAKDDRNYSAARNVYSDCTNEELRNYSRNKFHVVSKCQLLNELQCTSGCAKCFKSHKLCVYELDDKGNLMHCPSGSHLKNCTLMQCNNMFKCHQYYCIPYR